MQKVRVAGFGVSLDGFSAGIEQSLGDPLGKRGTEIFQWFFHTRTFCSMHGGEGGSVGDIDDEFAHRAMDNFGAFILGRNMFGPNAWSVAGRFMEGLVGRKPTYYAPTFVLTQYEREPVGTTCICPPGLIDCGAVCVDTQTNSGNCGACSSPCPASAPQCCRGVCKNEATDSQNCGRCGNVCPTTCDGMTLGQCVAGTCTQKPYVFVVESLPSQCFKTTDLSC